MPCAWDRRRVHWVGNEVRLFTAPVHPGVCFSRRDGQNMCVFADTTDGQCCLGESDPCEVSLNRNIRVSFGFLFFFCAQSGLKIWLRGVLLSLGFAIKPASILVIKKQACVYYIWTDEKKGKKKQQLWWGDGGFLRSRPGLVQIQNEKPSSWITPRTNTVERCICFFVRSPSPPSTLPPPPPPSPPLWADRQRSVSQLVLLVERAGLSLLLMD